ncbi:MAG: FG-GAP and VCBS repeat-containing protein, partial [Solirubrobacteraceae bacterium]
TDATNPQSVQITGGQLGIFGQTLSGDFSFAPSADGVAVTASNVGLSLGGGAVSITGGTGALELGGGTLAGTISAVGTPGSPGVSFAVPGVTFATTGFSLAINTGTNTTLTILKQTLTGNFSVEVASVPGGGTATTIVASNVSITIGGATGGVSLTNGQGALLVTSGGVAGQISGNVALNLPSVVSITGNLELAINNTTSQVDQTLTVGGDTVTVSLPAGPYVEFQATGAAVTVLNQTVTGDLALIQESSIGPNGANSATPTSLLEIGVANGATSFGSLLSVKNVTGGLFIEPSGVAGTLSADVSLSVPNVTLTGTLGLQFNTGMGTVNDSIQVGGTTVTVNVGGGPYVEVAGTGLTLTVLGQTLSGDLAIASTPGQLQITANNLTAKFGGTAAAPVLTAVQMTPNAQFVISSAGVAGSIAMNVTLSQVPGLSLGGTFGLDINTTSAAVNALPPGPYVRVDATNATLTIIGQTISGSVAIQKSTDSSGASVVSIGITGGSVSLAGGAVSASNISGLLLLSSGSIAGTVSASVSLGAALSSTAALSGVFTVSVNTGSAAVNDSFTVGGQTVSVDLPAGPYMNFQATGATVTVLGQTLTGDFTVRQVTTGPGADGIPGNSDDPQAVEITIANGALGLGDGTANLLTLSNITGDLLVFKAPNAGVAGQLSADVALNGIPHVSLSGTLGLQFNTTGFQVTATYQDPGQPTPTSLTIASTQTGVTPTGTGAQTAWFEVTGTGVTLTVAGQTLTGDFTFTKGSGNIAVTFQNVSLGLGNGTTNFVSVTQGQGSISLSTADGITGNFTGDVAINVPNVSFSGAVTVTFTDVSNSPSFTITGGSAAKPVTLTIEGQTIGADTVTITSTTDANGKAVSVAVTNLTLAFGPAGARYVNITPGEIPTADLMVDSNGVAAFVTGSLPAGAFSIPGAAITVTSFKLEINTGSQQVDFGSGNVVAGGPLVEVIAVGAGITIGSTPATPPTLSGDFVFDQSTETGFATQTGQKDSGGTAITNDTAIAVGDVNGDGFPDIVVGTANGVELYLNKGKDPSTGAWDLFAPGIQIGTGKVTAVALVDVNNDALPDLIYSTGTTTSIFVNPGNPATTLTAALISGATTIHVGSTNGFAPNGTLMIAGQQIAYTLGGDGQSFTIANTAVTATVVNGTSVTPAAWQGFGSAVSVLSTPGATSLAIGDLNGDGLPDIVVGATGTTVSDLIFLNNGFNTPTLTAQVIPGATSIPVTSTAGYASSGTLVINGLTIPYTGLASGGLAFTISA